MKIITVIGARPQFIKASAVSRVVRERSSIKEVIVHTGQHFDEKMSQVFFDELSIPMPHYNLGVHGVSHGAMTGKMLEGIEEIAIREKPDYLLVYGDTNSTLAGALAAAKIHIPVAHVEAGLRSFNMRMPEEINRILTDRISSLLFCPTNAAIQNLKDEGFDRMNVEFYNVGDVMYDATLHFKQLVNWNSPVLQNFRDREFVLCTIHRAENTDDENRLAKIVKGLNEIAATTEVVVPLHPRTSQIIDRLSLPVRFSRIDPVGYLDMLGLIQSSQLVMTDSGGLQKEAYFLNKFCITMRDETEWVELVENGYNFLVGAEEEKMIQKYQDVRGKKIDNTSSLYGNGDASDNIVRILQENHR